MLVPTSAARCDRLQSLMIRDYVLNQHIIYRFEIIKSRQRESVTTTTLTPSTWGKTMIPVKVAERVEDQPDVRSRENANVP
mmetsp:Transcript_60248/g.67392  ORF Transcript_60248/g.67392 Transcript_60248/m.67392 type:complete len:81 (+) Transcript_60248:145-387(+)